MKAPFPSRAGVEHDDDHPTVMRILDRIFDRYHLDFRNYSYSSIKRRMLTRVKEENLDSLDHLATQINTHASSMDQLLLSLTIHVTTMFRDPAFFAAFRTQVIPVLRTYSYLRLWVAGCSTGEEVFSLAIVLHEEGLYSRCRIYATDINDRVITQAKSGIFPLSSMQAYTRNYQRAGGTGSFADYYTADSNFAILRPWLSENIVFAAHNLSSDASFNEFQAIFCRNVMIYFNRPLQNRVHSLLHESLVPFGYLGLGRSETVRFSAFQDSYESICSKERIFRKIR